MSPAFVSFPILRFQSKSYKPFLLSSQLLYEFHALYMASCTT